MIAAHTYRVIVLFEQFLDFVEKRLSATLNPGDVLELDERRKPATVHDAS
jgi:hypothetical protein